MAIEIQTKKPVIELGIPGPSGGGGQVQPDWNQNDDTKPDYVKNRPFYTGDPVETVLVEESTVPFAPAEDGLYFVELQSTFVPTVGETYKVSWDGTTYESTCVNFNRFQVIGNLSIVGVGSDTGEPFLANVSHGERIQIMTADTSASHTFSISRLSVEVVKIDPKYIRDMYYTADLVETVFVVESTITFAENNGLYMANFPSTFEATVGEAYKVSWDGTVYECTCVLIQGLPAIGNSAIMGHGSDSGEPFLMGVENGKKITILTADTSAYHTFSISGLITEVVKIDEKYLPDTIATKSDVEVAQTTAETAQTTAETAQTTAETALPLAGGKMTGNIVTKEGVGIQADTVFPHRIILSNKVTNPDVAFEKYATNHDNEIYLYAGFTNMGAYNSYVKFLFDKGGNTARLILPSPSSGSTLPSVLVLEGANNEHTSVVVDNVNTIVFRKNSLSNDYYHLKADDNGSLVAENFKGIILNSSTAGSTKQFRITVDDSGTISATEVTSP